MVCGPTFAVAPGCAPAIEARPVAAAASAAPTRAAEALRAAQTQSPGQSLSLGLGLGLGLAATAAATGGAGAAGTTRRQRKALHAVTLCAKKKKEAEPEVDLAEILRGKMLENPTLSRFVTNETVMEDAFLAMEPTEFDDGVIDVTNGGYISKLYNAKNRGEINSVEFTNSKNVDGTSYIVAIVNTDVGVVCGFGSSTEDKKKAKHAAAYQAEQHLFRGEDPVEELRAAVDAGEERGRQAIETIDALSEKLKDTSLVAVQPFGTFWKARYAANLNRWCAGISAGSFETKEGAVAAAGQAFYQNLRLELRIPKDAEHNPEEWAEIVNSDVKRQNLSLTSFGDAESEAMLAEVLGTDEEREALAKALEDATARQIERIAGIEELAKAPEGSVVPEEGKGNFVARRVFEVTKLEDEDWRREEIKGKLPAEKVRAEIGAALERNQAVIVSGGTGSGKSTQLPQFILDDFREWEQEGGEPEPLNLEVGATVEVEYEEEWYACEVQEVAEDQKTISVRYFEGDDEEGDVDVKARVRAGRPAWMRMKPKIVVTQPRRIAATSLAQRVAWERYQDECGNEVGHAIRGDTIMPTADTGTIEFCTVGTLLKRVVTDPMLTRYNVVILDEVHERDLMTDFLLNLLKEVLTKRPDLRLVLMSATLDVQTFVNYLPSAHVVEVPTGTRYPVEEIHLEDDFFQDFPETQPILNGEIESRDEDSVSKDTHDFAIAGKLASDQEVRQQVADYMASGDNAQAVWDTYSERMFGGEEDPTKINADALRSFLAEAAKDVDDNEDEGVEQGSTPALAVLTEQVKQVSGYSDDVRQAWKKFQEEKEGELDAQDLLSFLETQGIRPWNAGRASWEVVSSFPWWGEDTANNVSDFLKLAERTILQVYPELLAEPVEEDAEIGVGSILCFLPGWAEIKKLAETLEQGPDADKLWVLRLHSSVTKEEQQQIFEPAEEGKIKVILGTNIAESSVTINDVRVVIDGGLHRELTYDPKRRMSSLDTVWICQSNAVQRKGRAGRVRSGRVFRLYSRDQFASVPWRPAPEMQRCNLAKTCLQSVHLGRDPREFLASAPDPPTVSAVEAAMAELVSIDAIKDGNPPQMLPVGQILSRFPLEPLLGRTMLYGTIFGVPQMTAAVLAVAAGRSPFLTPLDKRDEAWAVKKQFCNWSDTVGALRALMEFEKVYCEKGEEYAKVWADYNFLNYFRMMSLSRIKYQLLLDVQRSGLLGAAASEGMNPEEWGWGAEGDWDEEEGEGDEEEKEEQEEEREQEEVETYQDSAGAIFEADEKSMVDYKEWLDEMRDGDKEVQDEKLLIALLCAAYPANFAYRHKPEHAKHCTSSASNARIQRGSVNATKRAEVDSEENEDQQLEGPTWWLYSDKRMFKGQLALIDTTLLTPWDVALFGGLRSRMINDKLELDNWITVEAEEPEHEALLLKLREELRQAPIWMSIATSWDKVAAAATHRNKALFNVVSSVLMGQEADAEAVESLKSWKLPEIEDGNVLSKTVDEDKRMEIEESLYQKTVAELKVLLREMGEKVSGRKADLVTRCADMLIYGEDGPPEPEWEEGEGEGEDWGEEGEGEEEEESVEEEETVDA